MSRGALRAIGAILYCIGLALAAKAFVPSLPADEIPVFVHKLPRPPGCSDCGQAITDAR